MTQKTKDVLVNGVNTFCYALIIVVCCAVITLASALVSFASIAQVL